MPHKNLPLAPHGMIPVDIAPVPDNDAAAVSRGPMPADGSVGRADTEPGRYVVVSKPTMVVNANKQMEAGNWQLRRGTKER